MQSFAFGLPESSQSSSLGVSSSVSPHGQNRICSNAKLVAHSAGEYPVGSVGAKELFDANGAITGYALEIKTKAGAADAWHWYEILNGKVVANGLGLSGCGGCHSAAGSDASHSGHDFVYTQVK